MGRGHSVSLCQRLLRAADGPPYAKKLGPSMQRLREARGLSQERVANA